MLPVWLNRRGDARVARARRREDDGRRMLPTWLNRRGDARVARSSPLRHVQYIATVVERRRQLIEQLVYLRLADDERRANRDGVAERPED